MHQTLEVIKSLERTYQPGPHVANHLQGITLVPLIGPSGIGKSTQIQAITELEHDFGRVQSSTDRDPRPGEAPDQYKWLPRGPATYETIHQKIIGGNLVQFAVHPLTSRIYCSESGDYDKPFMMLDALHTAIEPIRRLPFKDMVEISLVITYNHYEERSRKRFSQVSPVEALKRRLEAVDSLVWSLDQGKDMIWVHNSKLTKTAREIIGLAKGEREPNPHNRRIAEQLLRKLRESD